MNADYFIFILLEPATWIWAGALLLLVLGEFRFLDRLFRKGVYDEDSAGRSDRAGAALSELQTLFNPAHKHVREEREQKRAERDDSGEPPKVP